jgi:hypothetical protein
MTEVQIAHHVAGRLRLRAPRLNRNELRQLTEQLAGLPGVQRTDSNELTGSIKLHYDAAQAPQLYLALARRFGLELGSSLPEYEPSLLAESIESTAAAIDRGVQQLTFNGLGAREIFPLGMAAYAFFFIDRMMGAPLWLSMLFFSFSSYCDLHPSRRSDQKIENVLEEIRDELRALNSRRRPR